MTHFRRLLLLPLILLIVAPLQATEPCSGPPGFDCPDPDVSQPVGFATNTACAWVDQTDPGCDDDGEGTCDVPFCSIQRAYDLIDIATEPNGPDCPNTAEDCRRYTILVLPGDYNECVDATTTGADRPVRLVAQAWLAAGEPGPMDPNFDSVTTMTTLDGDGQCDASGPRAPVVAIAGTSARVEGFKIMNGGKSGVSAKGGVAITKNYITENESDTGGGIYLYTATCDFAGDVSAVISSNKVIGNAASDFANQGFGDGGGIGVIAEKSPTGSCLGGTSEVMISDNVVYGNSATNPSLGDTIGPERAQGGGIYATGQSAIASQETQITITRNLISGNTATGAPDEDLEPTGFGGGIFALGFGYGSENFYILDNYVGPDDSTDPVTPGNDANGSGGGISSWATSISGRHTLVVDGNDVQGNTASRGAGIDLLGIAQFQGPCSPQPCDNNVVSITASSNFVANNTSDLDGGGMLAELQSIQVTDIDDEPLVDPATLRAEEVELTILANEIRENTAGLAGGGVFLSAFADADPFGEGFTPPNCPPAQRAASTIDFHRNLIADNVAQNLDPDITGNFVGPGILADVQARGDALATVAISTSTIADNAFDPIAGYVGYVGGLEFYANAEFDCNEISAGEVFAIVDRTIIDGNEEAGVGGILLPTEIALTRTLSHGNTGGDYEDFVTFPGGLAPPGNFDVNTDPLLEPLTYLTPVCSPAFYVGSCSIDTETICFDDAECTTGGDFCDFEGAGFLSNPDSNYDDVVDGVDLLRTIVSFGSSTNDARYNADSDLNGSGRVEGNDLMYTADVFGVVCLP